MIGPKHYQEAERLAQLALDGDDLDEPARHRYALVAQIHATLALAAATALHASKDWPCHWPEVQQWDHIAAPEGMRPC